MLLHVTDYGNCIEMAFRSLPFLLALLDNCLLNVFDWCTSTMTQYRGFVYELYLWRYFNLLVHSLINLIINLILWLTLFIILHVTS